MKPTSSHLINHASDGTDPSGTGLEISIRIGPDGILYFHDIPPALVEVALAMNPAESATRSRLEKALKLAGSCDTSTSLNNTTALRID